MVLVGLESDSVMAKTTKNTSDDLERNIDERCEHLSELLADNRHKEMMGRYEVGAIVLEIKRAATGEKYGKKRVKAIADEHDVSASVLYDACDVAEAWSKPEFEKLTGMRNANGKPISFNVLVEISHAEPATRSSLIETATTKSLSVREVKALVSGKEKEEFKAPNGEPTVRERDLVLAMFQDIATEANGAAVKLSVWCEKLPLLDDLAGTHERIEWLDNAIESMDEIRLAYRACRKALLATRGRMVGADTGNVPTVEAA